MVKSNLPIYEADTYLPNIKHPGIILINPIASLVHFTFRNPNRSSSITSFILLANLLQSKRATIFPVCEISATIFPVCEIRLIAQWSLHLFGNAINASSSKTFGQSPSLSLLTNTVVIFNPLLSASSLGKSIGMLSSLISRKIRLNNLFSNTLILSSSLNVRDYVSQP